MVHQIDLKVVKTKRWPQWIAAVGGTLLLLQIGIMGGWSSPYIAQLTSPESRIPMTMTEASWVVSLLNLGRLIGAICGSVCVNYLGTKTTILMTSVPMALSWIFILVANHVRWLYLARCLGGMSLGMTYSSFSLYLGEIADPSIRGALVTLSMSGLSIGNLAVSIMGAYLPMRITSVISLIFCLILMAIFVWLPESPHHFIKKNLDEKAKSSIMWYHRGCDVENELNSLKKFIESYGRQSFVSTLSEFRSPRIKKALVLTTVLFMYSQMCGLNNVLFYMETILRTAHVSVIDPSFVVIIVMCFGMSASCLSLFLIDRFGRKILMVISCFGITIALSLLGTGFQLLGYGYDPWNVQVFPILGVIFFHVFVFIGVLSVPNAVLGELFPPHVKCLAACFGSITAGIFSFISTATYQPLIELLSEQYVFFFYALILVSGIPFTLIFVPETKGKSLQEIQSALTKKG